MLSHLARTEEWPPCDACGSERVFAVVHPFAMDDALKVIEASDQGRLPGVVADDDLRGIRPAPPQWECQACGRRFNSPLPRYRR